MTLASPNIGPGNKLPNASYATTMYQGEGKLPDLTIIEGFIKRTNGFLLVAQDADGVVDKYNGEPQPIFVRANIDATK